MIDICESQQRIFMLCTEVQGILWESIVHHKMKFYCITRSVLVQILSFYIQSCNTFKKDSWFFIESDQNSGKQQNVLMAYARLRDV